MLEIAREKADAANIDNVSFKQSTIEELEEFSDAFDVAMAHSILHLLENPNATIEKVYKMLKPGGIFVTSTFCLGDANVFLRTIVPIARFFRIVPYVNILKRATLEDSFTNSGFEMDYQSEHGKKEAAFIILKKPTVSD